MAAGTPPGTATLTPRPRVRPQRRSGTAVGTGRRAPAVPLLRDAGRSAIASAAADPAGPRPPPTNRLRPHSGRGRPPPRRPRAGAAPAARRTRDAARSAIASGTGAPAGRRSPPANRARSRTRTTLSVGARVPAAVEQTSPERRAVAASRRRRRRRRGGRRRCRRLPATAGTARRRPGRRCAGAQRPCSGGGVTSTVGCGWRRWGAASVAGAVGGGRHRRGAASAAYVAERDDGVALSTAGRTTLL